MDRSTTDRLCRDVRRDPTIAPILADWLRDCGMESEDADDAAQRVAVASKRTLWKLKSELALTLAYCSA